MTRRYVVLREHKPETGQPVTFSVAGIVDAHDREGAVDKVHTDQEAELAAGKTAKVCYRAIPESDFDPRYDVTVEVIRKRKLVAVAGKTKAAGPQQPKLSVEPKTEERTVDAVFPDAAAPVEVTA